MAIPRSKKNKRNSAVQITQREFNNLKQRMQAFVMKRAFVIVIAAFYDTADLKWKNYFKSRKKMMEFIDEAVKCVDLYKGHIEMTKVVKFDWVADLIFDRTGIDYRTYWTQCAKDDRKPDEWKAVNNET